MFECVTCAVSYNSRDDCDAHVDSSNHWAPRIECEMCNDTFRTQSAADQHMSAYGHYRNYCGPCDRRFKNENNLRSVRLANPSINRIGRVMEHHQLTISSYHPYSILTPESTASLPFYKAPASVASYYLETYTETRAAYNGKAWEYYIYHQHFASSTGTKSTCEFTDASAEYPSIIV